MAKTSIDQFDTTAANNTDVNAVSCAVGWPAINIGNVVRNLMKLLKQYLANSVSVASASTVDLGAQTGNYITITGTTTITAFGTVAAGTWKQLKFSGVLTLTYNATSLILPGAANITTAAGDTALLISEGSGNWRCLAYSKASGLPTILPTIALPTKFIAGMVLSNDGSSINTVLDISSGSCRSIADDANIAVASNYTKSVSAWAVGTGNGALDTGSIAINTWYHVYAIRRSDTGVTDYLFSTNATTPTMPTNYDSKRRIGAFKTDLSGNIPVFTQYGDGRDREFWWSVPPPDVDATNPGTAAVSRVISTPLGVKTKAFLNFGVYNASGQNCSAYVSSLDLFDMTVPVVGTAALGSPGATVGAGLATTWIWNQAQVWTDINSTIRTRLSVSAATTHLGVVTLGWMENL